MLKICALFALALSLAVATSPPVICLPGQILSITGCINSCDAPKYDNCPDIFPALYNPSFCAWSNKGEWVNFTYECQACTTPGILGVKDGACPDVDIGEPIVTRPRVRPETKPARPIRIDEDYKSPRKAIRPLITQIEQQDQAEGKARFHRCPFRRPNEDSCPTIQYFVAPELNYCGVTQDGQHRGYDLACSACKDKEIVGFFALSCEDAPVKNPRQIRQNRLDRWQERPVLPKHTDNSCANDDCCLRWQFCLDGVCTDRCALMRCASGGCYRGRCTAGPIRVHEPILHADVQPQIRENQEYLDSTSQEDTAVFAETY